MEHLSRFVRHDNGMVSHAAITACAEVLSVPGLPKATSVPIASFVSSKVVPQFTVRDLCSYRVLWGA
jgi:hypothetical protein